MQAERTFPGVVLYANGDCAYAAVGPSIWQSLDAGVTWRLLARLPVALTDRVLSASVLLQRCSRRSVHHIVPVGAGRVLVMGYGRAFVIDSSDGRVEGTSAIEGSRPLCVAVSGDEVYYGEYRRNARREPIHVWASTNGGLDWHSAYEFHDVRHVHGVFVDPYSDAIWVTTGDRDEESAIWITTDGFSSLERVCGGSQQYRAIQLLFTPDHVYFGSDTPQEVNAIYRMQRLIWEPELLRRVEGSVFFGAHRGRSLLFCTACEPSKVNPSRHVSVWRSDDYETWYEFARFRKDAWPMKLFQYGYTIFSAGVESDETLWITPFAVKAKQVSSLIRLADQ